MYRFYLTEEDLLKVEQFSMVALINEAANSDIIEFVENLVNGVGSGYNYSNCSFWDDLDEYDQDNTSKFDGLWVSNEGGEEVIVSFNDVSYYLETLYSRLTNEKYDKLYEPRKLLDAFKVSYCNKAQGERL